MHKTTATVAIAAALALGIGAAAQAQPKTNFLSQWDTGSDAASIAKLGEMFEAAGGKWQATSIAGHTANTLAKLRADVVAGNAPPAVQLKGPEIAEWNDTGMTANLDKMATEEGWDKVVAPELLPVMKPKGSWVAVPMNIHRINWMWGSKKVMDAAGVKEMPKSWADFDAACDKIKAIGKICLVHRAVDWIDATVFEDLVYGTNVDLFRKAFMEADLDALRSDEMIAAFDHFRRILVNYADPGMTGRDSDTATAMVGNGDGAFYIMGDWQIGTWKAAGYEPGKDILCRQSPTDWDGPGYVLNSDSVVLFTQKDPEYIEGQTLLAHLIMTKDFQTIFNQKKGSIPARLDVDLSGDGWNACQRQAQADLKGSIENGTLVRSMAHNMTVLQKYRGAMMDVITEFVATPEMSAKDAANNMADAVEAEM